MFYIISHKGKCKLKPQWASITCLSLYTPTRKLKRLTIPSVRENANKKWSSHTLLVRIESSETTLEKKIGSFLNICLLYDSAGPLSGIHVREKKGCIYTMICMQKFIGALFVIFQDWKQPQKSIKGWLDKQIVVNPYKGILHSNIKEQAIHTCHNTAESQINYGWKKPDRLPPKKSTYCINPYLLNSRKCKLIYNDRNHISGCLVMRGEGLSWVRRRDDKEAQGNFWG